MADVVNLRQARKRAARADKDAAAIANRAKYGLSKQARSEGEAQRLLELRRLDAHRRETIPGESGEV